MIKCLILDEDISESFCNRLCKYLICTNHPVQIQKRKDEEYARSLYSKGMVFCESRDRLVDIRWCNRCRNSRCKWHPVQIQLQQSYQ